MPEDYKLEAAKAAMKFIKPNQMIGLGAGSSIAHLVALLAEEKAVSTNIVFATPSAKTAKIIQAHHLKLQPNNQLQNLDIYFDGCDQFDKELNALKSGGGIHTSEKIMASMAKEFILIGDAEKYVQELNTTYPLVIEVLPMALQTVTILLKKNLQNATINIRMSIQNDTAVVTENGNFLLDVYFTKMMDLPSMNMIKMMTGVVEHSLFYRMANKAIIAGAEGIKILEPSY